MTFNNHLTLKLPNKPHLPASPLTNLKHKLGLPTKGKAMVNSATGNTFRKSGSIKSTPAGKMPK